MLRGLLAWLSPLLLAAAVALAGGGPLAQGPRVEYRVERPGTSRDDPIERPRDLSGRSVKSPRVRVLHSRDARRPGSSAYLLFVDPWLGYQRGRELFLREFTAADGVFGESGRHAGPVLDDGATRMQTAGHVSSCGMCHNTPYLDAGFGPIIAKNGGSGRRTPHLFGAGLLEMLGWQLRQQFLGLADRDRDGWIRTEESRGVRAVVHSLGGRRGSRPVDFGRFGDRDGDGRPDLDPILHVYYLDAAGRRIPWARSLDVPGVAGYSFEFQVFGFGQRGRAPAAGTLRTFAAQAWDVHSGLQACDGDSLREPREDGLAGVTLAGAQLYASGASRDRGQRMGPGGVSLDDPDRDGVVEEISAGDLDLAEWYMLNHPAPAQAERTPAVRRGEQAFHRIGCGSCHVPDWRLEPAAPHHPDPARRFAGDRRFFELQVQPGPDGHLHGAVRLLADRRDGRWRRRLGAARVAGLYSDLRTHDLGPENHQLQFDGSRIRRFRTTPLWGTGSASAWMHDGRALSLDEAIARHGGEAAASRRRYRALAAGSREDLKAFLRSLVLYSTRDLPTDVNGDGRIDAHFHVAGRDTGRESFNPEWLFRIPGAIEGPAVGADGGRITSFALTNLRQAYGLDLPYLRDRNRDGFPDILGFTPPPGR